MVDSLPARTSKLPRRLRRPTRRDSSTSTAASDDAFGQDQVDDPAEGLTYGDQRSNAFSDGAGAVGGERKQGQKQHRGEDARRDGEERQRIVAGQTIHAPNRLRVCAFLAATTSTEFSVLRDVLGMADSVLSKHLKVLQDAGYVDIEKPTGRGRVKTWVSLTPTGRKAYARHVAALRALIDSGSGVDRLAGRAE